MVCCLFVCLLLVFVHKSKRKMYFIYRNEEKVLSTNNWTNFKWLKNSCWKVLRKKERCRLSRNINFNYLQNFLCVDSVGSACSDSYFCVYLFFPSSHLCALFHSRAGWCFVGVMYFLVMWNTCMHNEMLTLLPRRALPFAVLNRKFFTRTDIWQGCCC